MNPRKDLVHLVAMMRAWGCRLATPALANEMNTTVEKLRALLDENEREWTILKRHLSLVRDMAETSSAMPANLDPFGKLAWRTIIEAVAADMAPEPVSKLYTGGCTSFSEPTKWQQQYGHSSKLIVVYDGGNLRPYFEPDGDNRVSLRLAESLQRALTAVGLYSEACTCTYSAIYVEDPDKARPFLISEE